MPSLSLRPMLALVIIPLVVSAPRLVLGGA
jgi:hypothetical protein